MTYTPFLISNFATGLDRALQPWLLIEDAWFELLDGFVYRGVTTKRDGYTGFATGNGGVYTESRMVHQIVDLAPATGVIDGANATFTFVLTTPVSRGSVTITGSNPAQVLVDDGVGGFTGDGTGTINYTTGAVSITFTLPPAALSTVLATYSYHQGYPVMGVMNFFPTNNVRQLIVVDTHFVNRYNPTTNRLEDISPATPYLGGSQDFFGWVNYASATSVPRLLFSNRVAGDVIQQYDGSAVTNYAPTFTTGAPPVPVSLNARQMFNVRDRLVLFQTIEGGTLYPRRIRISGFGANSDVFDNTAPGAGFIDIPDNTWYYGAAFNRDDIVFFTEAATWMLKYTGNDVTPFILEKLDPSRGSKAAFSVITYLNRTMAASPRGLINSDGYNIARMDDSLPDFTFNDINNKFFDSCFSGFLDEDRDVYMTYPSVGVIKPALVSEGSSDRILVANFEEDNYCIYRLPLSTIGNFQTTQVVLWQDLTAANGYPDWDTLAAKYGNWNEFPFNVGSPITIGGGHKGEIWKMNDTELADNIQAVRGITIIDPSTIRVTSDWNNYEVGDYIVFSDVEGMTEINNKQGVITAINVNYTTFDVKFDFTGISNAYTGGGFCSRVIPFECTSKKFNPYSQSDRKVKVGWVYFYISVVKTFLTDSNGDPVPALLDIEMYTNDTSAVTTPSFKYQINCSEVNSDSGSKKWVKMWVNQTSRFVQFKFKNTQAGAKIQIHAVMPGFQGIGRLI